MTETSIELHDVHLTLGGKTILDNISVSFFPGQLTVLLGPNGAGKSSLLKMISGEWKSQGQISYFGSSAQSWDPSTLARHLGVLPQSSSLSFNFKVHEVVELGGMPLTANTTTIKNIAQSYMQATDIEHLANRLYPNLSGGEKQRVHLARVLTQLAQSGSNKILLLDEPTSASDLCHQHTTLQLARKLTAEGATVIAVIHDLNLAAKYADRILMLHQARLIADGAPWQTLTADTIAKVYGWPVEVIPHPHADYPIILS